MTDAPRAHRYAPPAPDGHPPRALAAPGGTEGPRFPFYGKLEIGRDDGERALEPGLLLVPDPTVSRLHCVIVQRPGGHCVLRDVSRNGTRLDGRRLAPNVDTPLRPGQAVTVGAFSFVLEGEDPSWSAGASASSEAGGATLPHPDRTVATVVVGDIRDYTVLVRTALSEQLQRAVRRVFERLTAAALEQGGTVKEYQGDAILAFWEGDAAGTQVSRACRAVLALDDAARRIGADGAIWPPALGPLELHWAVSTGVVLIDSFGKGQVVGLSMIGEPVVRAFRIEKYAGGEAGRIVACRATREAAGDVFAWYDLGEREAKGFDRPDRVFSLLGEAGRVPARPPPPPVIHRSRPS